MTHLVDADSQAMRRLLQRVYIADIHPDEAIEVMQTWPDGGVNLRDLVAGETCGLCGHETSVEQCGYARVEETRLCHADSHSCYDRWTIRGERP